MEPIWINIMINEMYGREKLFIPNNYLEKRNRSWRRYMEEKHTIRRIKITISKSGFFRMCDINDIRVKKVNVSSYLGLYEHFKNKSYYTDKYTSKYKIKYSTNKCKTRWDSHHNTRESNKREFLKILKNNGIK